METHLTRDADRVICLIYKEYLSRRKCGMDKRHSRDFSDRDKWPAEFLQEFSSADFLDTLRELRRFSFIHGVMDGGFVLEYAGVAYMERRFPDGISQVLDWLGKIKSAIPFA